MKKLNIKYKVKPYGKWIPKDRNESIEVKVSIDPEQPISGQVMNHCQSTIDSSIVEVMIIDND